MSGIVLDLDRQMDNVSKAHLIDDLTYPTSVLEISFLSSEKTIGKEVEFIFAGAKWKMNSHSSNPSPQTKQITGLAVISGALDPVTRAYPSSQDILGHSFTKAEGRFSNVKFGTPIKGDTLSVILRQLQFQSFEENYNSLETSYCLSLTSQGFIASTWASLYRSVEKFQQRSPLVKPELLAVNDADYYKYDHDPVPSPVKQFSYFNQLFGDKITMNSNVGLSIGRTYSFDLDYWGMQSTSKYLLIRQELNLDSQASAIPYKQVFAEVRNAGRYN